MTETAHLDEDSECHTIHVASAELDYFTSTDKPPENVTEADADVTVDYVG